MTAPSPRPSDTPKPKRRRWPRTFFGRIVIVLYLVTWVGGTVSHYRALQPGRVYFSVPLVPGLLLVFSSTTIEGSFKLVVFSGSHSQVVGKYIVSIV